MAKFIYTGEEYINVDHIVTIDMDPENITAWILLDNGIRISRKIGHIKEFLDCITM